MKSIQTKTTTALLILAASAIPAFSQDRGRDRGGDRGFQRSERQEQGSGSFQQQRWQGGQQMQSRQAPQDFQSQRQQPQNRFGGFQSQPQQYQPQPQQYQPQPQQGQPQPQQGQLQRNFQQRQDYQQPQAFQQQRSQQDYRQQDYRQQDYRQQNYRQQNYRQQNYRQQNYRPDARSYGNEFRGGASYGGFNSRGWQGQGNSWSARGGYRGYVIPQSRFYGSFGRDHFFRIGRPQYYGGYARFQYGGYMFRLVDPFPAFWGPDWYDTDSMYIDYQDGGYYLYDSQYPDEGVPVEIDN